MAQTTARKTGNFDRTARRRAGEGVATAPRSPERQRRLWDLRRWLPPRRSRPVIASMPVFRGCDRRQVWRIARWGEVLEAAPGDILVREDYTDYWFFVILSGSVQASRGGRALSTLGPGDHFGETAIVGFRPQAATLSAVAPTVLFVLGRRHLLALAARDRSIQRALFPATRTIRYTSFVRELQAEGRADWERLRPRYRSGRTFGAARLPGRELSWSDALDMLSHQAPAVHQTADRREPHPIAKRQVFIPVCVAVALLGVFSALYHPPAAVVTPGRAVDVIGDISITGAPAHKPSGRYLLTPVNVERPNLAGLALARILGRSIVGADTARSDPQRAKRLAHNAFLNSHHQAIAVAEQTLRVKTGGVTIAIRDRGLNGPSAGLVYALAIVDMLGRDDLARGRVIAATGAIERNGSISGVGFVSLKGQVARRGRADVFLVPQSQVLGVHARGTDVIGVANLREAVNALRRR